MLCFAFEGIVSVLLGRKGRICQAGVILVCELLTAWGLWSNFKNSEDLALPFNKIGNLD